MVKPWLLCDVETTGTDPAKDRLVEVGAVLFDPGHGIPLQSHAMLVRGPDNAAAAINGIPPAALQLAGAIEESAALALVRSMAVHCDYLLAHQAAFDRQWLDATLPDTCRWVCTTSDADWPRCHKTEPGLTTLALSYGCGVSRAHRAVEDALTMAAVLGRVHELEGGLDAWLARALEPRVKIAAEVPIEENAGPKGAGFKWDPETGLWRRSVRVSQAEELRRGWTFETFDPSEPTVELLGEQERWENDLAKAAKFRWDPERKVWWRRVRASQLEAVRAGLEFKTREAA